MGQTVKVLDPFQSAQVADDLRGRFNPLDTLDPKADETVDMRPITVERTSGLETIVSQGLAAGETVVTDGQLRLVPGSRVAVKGPAAAAKVMP